jgi:hypothetical protein
MSAHGIRALRCFLRRRRRGSFSFFALANPLIVHALTGSRVLTARIENHAEKPQYTDNGYDDGDFYPRAFHGVLP